MAQRGSSTVYRNMAGEDPFTRVLNDTVRDYNLSLKALGLLTRLLSNANGWSIDSRSLARQFKEGRDAILAATNELIEHGYVLRRRYQDERGWFITEYQVFGTPQGSPPSNGRPNGGGPDMPPTSPAYDPPDAKAQVSPRPGFPDTDSPDTGFPAPDNTDVSKRTGPKEKDDDERLSPPSQVVENASTDSDDEFHGYPMVRLLANELAFASGRTIFWNLNPEQMAQLSAAIGRVGDVRPFVDYALDQDANHPKPGRTASAYVKVWKHAHAKPSSPSTTTTAPSRPVWCGRCDSDSYRFIDIGNDTWQPCPECNPPAPAF